MKTGLRTAGIVGAVALLVLFPSCRKVEKGASARGTIDAFGRDGWWVSVAKGEEGGLAVNRLSKEFSSDPYKVEHALVLVADADGGEAIGSVLQSLAANHPAAAVITRLADAALFRDHDPTLLDAGFEDKLIGVCSWACPVSETKIAIMAVLPDTANLRSEVEEMGGGCHTYSPRPPRILVYNPLRSEHLERGEHRRPPGFDDWWFRAQVQGLTIQLRQEDQTRGSARRGPAPRRAPGEGHKAFRITAGKYSEKDDLNERIMAEFGPNYRLADWSD